MYSKMTFLGVCLILTTLFGCVTASNKSDNCMDVIKTFYDSATAKSTLVPPVILPFGLIHYYAEGDDLHALCMFIAPNISCVAQGDVVHQCKMAEDMVLYYGSGVVTAKMIEQQQQQQEKQKKRHKDLPPI